jgi:hypothetical protein
MKFNNIKSFANFLLYYTIFTIFVYSVLGVNNFDDKKALFVFVPLFLLMMLLFIFIEKNKKNIFKSKSYVEKIIGFSGIAMPGTSMLSSLQNNNINSKDIKKIKFMTYSLGDSCIYFKNKLEMDLKNVDVEFYGYDDKKNNNICKNLIIHKTTEILKEHSSLIETKNGDFFVWYEPEHIEGDLKYGAYLIKVKEDNYKNIEKILFNSLELTNKEVA